MFIYYFVIIPPLLYLSFFGVANVGSFFSSIFLPLALIFSLSSNKVIFKKDIFVVLGISFFVFYFGINNLFVSRVVQHGFFYGTFWWLYLLVVFVFIPIPDAASLKKMTGIYFFVSAAVLGLDAVYRFFVNIQIKDNIELGRYAYKSGLIDIDSNYSGLYSLLTFFFCFYCCRKYRQYYFYLVLFAAMILLSMSVAAISVAVTMLIYFLCSNRIRLAVLIFATPVIMALMPFVIELILTDSSGSSKINLLTKGWDVFYNRNLYEMLVGSGFGSVLIDGHQPHLIILQLLLELGFLGFLLYYIVQFFFVFFIGVDFLFVFLPLFFIGLSVASISSPIVSALVIMMYYHIREN